MATVITPIQFCLRCGYTVDHATNVTGQDAPRPGDLTVCFCCGVTLKFGPKLTLLLAGDIDLSPSERRAIEWAHEHIRAVRSSRKVRQ